MEGVLTPFKSANIICTPNGVEATINIYANKLVYDLKPKTAVQIFYKDWINGIEQGWRLMFDGFFSAIVKEDESTQGRMVAITCRDFRMDLRKSPAYLSYTGSDELSSLQMYNMQGLYETGIVKGSSKPGSYRKVGNREYDNLLCTLASMMRYIAGTAYNTGNIGVPKSTNKTTPSPTLTQQFNTSLSESIKTSVPPPPAKTVSSYEGMSDAFQHDEAGKAKCGLFLDAFIRGMWSEAVGGTAIGVFLNKRIRMDKRFLVPSNRAGYNFWNRQSAGLEVGGYLMGDSRFSSLEAAIMRIAALFSVRVYSCNTPTLIDISKEKAVKNPYSAGPYAANQYNQKATTGAPVSFVIDDKVRQNLVDNPNNNFGGKYILNESMLLPPMEFTAPPNCNIFLPPFCNRTNWQFDMDSDITRAYYSVVDSMSAYDSTGGLHRLGVQVPNTLFDRSVEKSSLYKGNSKIDEYGRYKPPITLEERYKGVTLTYGQVNQDIAMYEVVAENRATLPADKKQQADKLESDVKNVNAVKKDSDFNMMNDVGYNAVADMQAKAKEIESKKQTKQLQNTTTNALRRHALIKYLNEKYAGRVVTIDMMFNPYPMCGFPGMFVDDEEAGGSQSAKTIIGMVQQIKHLIFISPQGAEASTTVLMNNARFIDEPTDMDVDGNALYMGKTNTADAEIDINTLLYKHKDYHIPEPVPETQRVLNSKAYDLAQVSNPGSVYAKDFLSITAKSSKGGRSNIYYLDKEYDPQHIPLFYEKVFKHTEHSFMIGSENFSSSSGPGGTRYFVYDTMHEAVTNLRADRKDLMYDYDMAMRFVSRSVCSADAFYQGILGLSILDEDEYINDIENFNNDRIKDEYFGVTTKIYNQAAINGSGPAVNLVAQSVTNFGKSEGLMTTSGEFSSILESIPLTAFIKERKIAVKNYILEANKVGQGMRFTVPEGSNG
jgi:hypothetical protein